MSGSDAWQDNVFKTRVRTEGGSEHVYLAACSTAQITISVADQTDNSCPVCCLCEWRSGIVRGPTTITATTRSPVTGDARLTFTIAVNEPSGHWSVTVRELYCGVEGRAYFNVAAKDNNLIQ